MVVEGVTSFSQSAGKPRLFLDAMRDRKCDLLIHKVEPVTKQDICLAHDMAYVNGVFDLTTPNGFGNCDPRIPPSTLWTIGSLTSALLSRHKLNGSVCSPTSGFHHAGHAFGGRYCTFNGIMVAAAVYLKANPLHKVGILDCDVHYGNGTDDIIREVPFFLDRVVHRTVGQHFTPGDKVPNGLFMMWLKGAVEDVSSCDVVIYQAGADMAATDPLGGYLSPTGMHIRDMTVFEALTKKVVWNLAGGYQDITDIINVHIRTARIAAEAAGGRANTMAKSQARMDQFYRTHYYVSDYEKA